ncbi:MAG: type II toxin-antitoxin system Phd/YefM family antitoxin [Nitrospirota bacterium]
MVIHATEFKARCLALLDDVARTGDRLIVLKHGKPVAEVVPALYREETHPQQTLSGTFEIVGDIMEPVLSPDDWEAHKE